jgi:uncharacterized protein
MDLSSGIASALDPGRLELTIMPTEQCNFRCTYCYEAFEQGTMSDGVVRGIKNLIGIRAPTLSSLDIGWFGGEPLMARDVIYDVCAHACFVAATHPRLAYTSGISTNGFGLDRTTFHELLHVGVQRFQISLDGQRDAHDLSRVTIKGGGTFDRIWRNVLTMSESPETFRTVLRMHVTPKTISSVLALAKTIRCHLSGDRRFSVFVKAIQRLGGPSDNEIQPLSRTRESQVLMEIHTILGGHVEIEEATDNSVCYASKANALVIRSNGAIGKCTVALSDKRNDIGQLNEDGSLNLDPDKLRPWLRGLVNGELASLRCPLRGLPN